MGTTQVVYALAALVVAALLSFQFLVGSRASSSQIYSNEILTQMSGVATGMIERIGTRAFDQRTREDLYPEPPDSESQLTASASFGGIANADACDTLCLDIDDFHGLTFAENYDGIDFDVEVTVRYVAPDKPDSVVTGPSYAKEVVLDITNPNIYRKGNPDSLITMEVSRVFTYIRTTL